MTDPTTTAAASPPRRRSGRRMTRQRVAEIVTWCLENPAVPRNSRTFGRQVAAMLAAEGLLDDDPRAAKHVVIEFDSADDYDEFLAQHHAQRCSDLGDWNTYRVVLTERCTLTPECEFPPHDPSAHPCGKPATEASTPFVLGGEGTP